MSKPKCWSWPDADEKAVNAAKLVPCAGLRRSGRYIKDGDLERNMRGDSPFFDRSCWREDLFAAFGAMIYLLLASRLESCLAEICHSANILIFGG